MRKALAALTAVALAVCFSPIAFAQNAPITATKSFTGVSSGLGPVMNLSGQNTCKIITYGGSSGFTVTVKGSSDGGASYETLTQFGSSGAITTDTTASGNLTGTVVALTNFTYVVTGTITGTLTVVETCSVAGSAPVAGTISGTVTANQGTSPWVVTTPAPQASIVVNQGTSPFVVTTPQPSFQNSSGVTRAVVCDKTATSALITTATTTLVVDAVNGKNIYVCYIQGVAIGSQTGPFAQLEYGTKTTTDCDTGPTAIQPPLAIATATGGSTSFFVNTGLVFGTPLQPISTQLCVVTTGSTLNMKIFVIYAQL